MSSLTTVDRSHDARVRTRAFDWLTTQCSIHGEVLPRKLLARGFVFGDARVRLLGPQGIFKPAVMQVPLSITTAPKGPYDDSFNSDHLLRYRYRGGPVDRDHRDNVGLRVAMKHGLPLAYFHGIVPGKYLAVWPVHVVGDDRDGLAFAVDVGAVGSDVFSATDWKDVEPRLRRRYASVLVQQRLHQGAFRERVLRAYRHQCALCRLGHNELLDAAHIIPDSEAGGEPDVTNGLALCRLHHSAFDRFFVGVRPDYIIEIRPDVLVEQDGPTLRHAIQGLHGRPIQLPRKRDQRPAIRSLEERYERFREMAVAS